MNDLIKINHDSSDRPTVMGRELHEALEIKTAYKDWFKRMCEYGFAENSDFIAIAQKRATAQGNMTTYTDHQLTIDMAKELCMIQRSEVGRKCRQYFIEVEKQWNSPEAVMDRALKYADQKIKQLEQERANAPISIYQHDTLRKEIVVKAIDLCGSGRVYSDIGVDIRLAIEKKLLKTLNVQTIAMIAVCRFSAAVEICRTFKPDAALRAVINSERALLKNSK